MLSVAVCDDEMIFCKYMKQQLVKTGYVREVNCYSNMSDLLEDIVDGYRFQIIFLDIDLHDDKDGIDYAEELLKIAPFAKVIYVTGYNERYSQLIFLKQSNLGGYLTKPINIDILIKYLKKAEEDIRMEQAEKLVVKSGGLMVTISLSEIYYLESCKHAVYIHVEDKEYTVYNKLDVIVNEFGDRFVQCHKSFAVNMDKIKQIEMKTKTIFLKDGTAVAISRSRLSYVKEKYFSYMGSMI